MLSERQRNIVVELTLAGLTAPYIADKCDCSISTIWGGGVSLAIWSFSMKTWMRKIVENSPWLFQYYTALQWPSQSPDPTIIEQIWDFMGRDIVKVIPHMKADLIRALHNSWLNITVTYLHNLYNFLPRRIRTVIRGRDYPTKYWLKGYLQKR